MNTNINLLMMIIAIGWALVYGGAIAIMVGMLAFLVRLRLRPMQLLNITTWSAAAVMLIAYLQLLISAS
jgi:hypothetical protein